jgi:hypothetical protein
LFTFLKAHCSIIFYTTGGAKNQLILIAKLVGLSPMLPLFEIDGLS